MPSALKKRPTIPLHLLEYWNGFVALDRTRMWSYGVPLGIQYSEVLSYGTIHHFTDEDMDEFTRLISVLDSAYMGWRADHGGT
jgi:hypothetical protein